jgi:glycerophosphoryl diester phosphodiesterase
MFMGVYILIMKLLTCTCRYTCRGRQRSGRRNATHAMLQSLGLVLLAVSALSYVLRRWPLLLHRRKPAEPSVWRRVRTIAHRGGRELTPENTLAAFENAVHTAGADAIELDVWLTQDGRVAVLHDGTLERTTGEAGHVTELTSEQLPQVWQVPSDGWAQGEGLSQLPAEKVRVPLLDDVLGVLEGSPDTAIMVEFKGPEPELAQKVLELLRSRGMLGRAACFSLDAQINAQLRAVPEFFLCSEVSKITLIFLLYHLGFIGFVPTSWFDPIFGFTASVFEGGEQRSIGFLHRIPLVRSLPMGAQQAIAENVGKITDAPKLFRHLQQRNVLVWCLGVNSEAKRLHAAALGADSVLTDRPNWLAEAEAAAASAAAAAAAQEDVDGRSPSPRRPGKKSQ